MHLRQLSTAAFLAALYLNVAEGQTPLGTGFTYQGRLQQNGQPYSGSANLVFKLFDASSGGNLLGTQTLNGVAVAGGLFTVQLNGAGEFGASAFNGDKRWLEISVNGTPLSPRQELTAAPYAEFAAGPWTTSGSNLSYSAGSVGVNTAAPLNRLHVVSGAVGDGIRLTGGSGTDPGFQFFNGANPGGGLGLAVSAGIWSQDAASGDLVLRSNAGNKLLLQSGALGSALAITGENDVGIGTTAPAGKLDVHTGGTLAVLGEVTAATGATIGVNGSSLSTAGTGVFGFAGAASGTTSGVYGQANSPTGIGVFGFAPSTSGSSTGVFGKTNCPNGNGVRGLATATTGLGNGVFGECLSGDPLSDGVYCDGNFDVTGNKSFRIDHPDDPENMYLLHYCSEGPEPLNVYQGRVVTDATGYAWVALPHYFEEINRAPEYVLTVIDGSEDFVLAKVTREIQDHQFQIRTSKPGVSVSWEVKAVRNDRWVQRYGAPVEVPKPASQRGTYQRPELYGQPPEMGTN